MSRRQDAIASNPLPARSGRQTLPDRSPVLTKQFQFTKKPPITPSPPAEESSSLNDDLMSVNSGFYKGDGLISHSGGLSVDSSSYRRSFESSSAWGRSGRGLISIDDHSGSLDFSPLGNNSIYEIVMNTRRKNWLGRPSVEDIPPVTLSKNGLQNDWKSKIDSHIGVLSQEYDVFQKFNNLQAVKGFGQLSLGRIYQSDEDQVPVAEEDAARGLQIYTKDVKQQMHQVPDFYFQDGFRLDDTRTFSKVLDDADLQVDFFRSFSSEERDNAHEDLQDKLNSYLDDIENLLVSEISSSSHKFFYALEDVDKIEDMASESLKKLDELSSKLQNHDEKKVRRRINLLRQMIKRKNIEKLEQGLLQIKKITELTEDCKRKYEDQKLDDCLDDVDHIERLIVGDDTDPVVEAISKEWPYKLLDLKSVPAISHVREYLTNLTIELGGMFALNLCDLLLNDVRRCSNSCDVDQFLQRPNKNGPSPKQELDTNLTEELKRHITQLARCDELASALQLFREKFMAELKGIVKQHLPQEGECEDPDKSIDSRSAATGSKLSRLIKNQTPKEFQEMLVNVFAREVEALKRLSKQQKVLLDLSLGVSLSQMSASDGQDSSEQHDMIMQLDITKGIHEGIRVIQLRMGKIISVRRDVNARLRYDHFLDLYNVCGHFVHECESITGEFLTKYLTDVLTMQIKNYSVVLNSTCIGSIKSSIEKEHWTPFIVPAELQRDVNDIVSSAEFDPAPWTSLSSKVTETTDTNENSNNQKGHKKSVVVSDKTFVASESLLAALRQVKSILVLSINLPSAFLATFERMCYDLLRYFNTSAMSTVSLDQDPGHISKAGKNLSIMGESLDCLAELTTYVQGFYTRLGDNSKDFQPLKPSQYSELYQLFQSSSDKLYQAHAPPPPI
ncbi:LAMI_0C05842g1_1 [Lachancea mirantina]|uniref:LAMI_0C05842g1_1 n=1 Tax=Lachancea mirantina TaxID=1230905 RepID=A0A1G4J2R8_9SACH|nr:LAMI_0C05842g1_1 [Lachancea mirantina]